MRARVVGAPALVAALVLLGCGADEDPPAAATTAVPTTIAPVGPPPSPPSTATVVLSGASDEEILAGVEAASPGSRARLPDAQWVRGIGSACIELPPLADDEIADFFELFRVGRESDGLTRAESRDMVDGLVGGIAVACPTLGVRLAPVAATLD
ncbi:MAG: hypothetical protein H0W25_05670 [Acidimicrobiia bacterium]|nr:hypothetical protein [Acidimicrobiia bacterium]